MLRLRAIARGSTLTNIGRVGSLGSIRHKFDEGFLNTSREGNDQANMMQLTPISFLERTARLFPDREAVVYNGERRTWKQTHDRCRKLALALKKFGVKNGDTVSIIAHNTPQIFEAHFGVPGSGAVLHCVNTRLDAAIIAFQLEHAESRIVFTDAELSGVVGHALTMIGTKHRPVVIDIMDDSADLYKTHPNIQVKRLGNMDYEAFLESAGNVPEDFRLERPHSEHDTIALNYTSGTTGNPKGVCTSHRGAYMNSISNMVAWPMTHNPSFMWVVPMFHCNGWCFPWSVTAAAGTNVCLRYIRQEAMMNLMAAEKVTHTGGAPIVLSILLTASDEAKKAYLEQRRKSGAGPVHMIAAGAAPPPSVMAKVEKELGIITTNAYGLTETYGPCTFYINDGDDDGVATRSFLSSSPLVEEMKVVKDDGTEVPHDGVTIGEILLKGNIMMKGYLKNEVATEEAFEGGYFHTGDLAVCHHGGRVEIKDRKKDIIISGGENISSIEVEAALHRHEAVMSVAVVAFPHDYWGEVPYAVVEVTPGFENKVTEAELISHCRRSLAHYKAPKRVIFGEIPKTSTGKIQKYQLRKELLASLATKEGDDDKKAVAQ